MALTKISRSLLDTGVSDSSDATAITIDSSERVGIGEASPLAKLHIKTADSGASADSGADELVLENSGDTGMTIMSGTSNSGSIRFGDSGDNDNGIIIYNHGSNPYMRFFVDGGERLRIDDSGNVGIGSTTPADKLEVAGNVLISDSSPELTLETGASHYNWQIAAQENLSSALEISVGSADADASNDTFSPKIYVKQAGDVEITDGNLVVASGHGIDFSATANTSATGGSTSQELLDDYEEGTWTATLSSSGGGFAASVTSFSGGHYTKIGNMVTAHIYTGSFNITNAGSGYAKISGLPYASMYSAADYGSAIFYHANCFAESSVTGYVSASADFTISTPTDQDAVGAVGWRVANTVYLMVQVQYMTPN